MTIDLKKLSAEFPRECVSWRAQTVTESNGKTSALALAYIDGRDVMNRLDEVCGVSGWQCRYTHAEQKTVCEIGIKIEGEWIWKADGAGDTDIEAEKGSLTDAYKRAAVRWGVGRYLYSLGSPWVPCEAWFHKEKNKWIFKSFKVDPWTCLQAPVKAVFDNASLRNKYFENVINSFDAARSMEELEQIRELNWDKLMAMKVGSSHDVLTFEEIYKQFQVYKGRFTKKQEVSDSFGQEFADTPTDEIPEPPSDLWEQGSPVEPETAKQEVVPTFLRRKA